MNKAKNSSTKYKDYRLDSNQKVILFEEVLKQGGSQRTAEKLTGIPRMTYQHLSQRQQKCNLNDTVKDFFHTQEGLDFLHRMTLAANFVITQVCGGGIGAVQTFYELALLDNLTACSDGTLHKCLSTLERNLIHYGEQQFEKQGQTMPAKAVTCALDETFPSGICLVGIEVESNFILLEQFADKRDCDTWHEAMKDRLSALPITVIQVVSDEAKALVKYTRDILQAHHSPDVFHVQQDIINATTPTLRAGVKSARKVLQQANNRLQALVDIEITHRSNSGPMASDKRLRHHQKLDEAAEEQAMAIEHLVETSTRREDVLQANRGIGEDYHPFDLTTGEKRTPEKLTEQLNARFAMVNGHAEMAGVSGNSIKKIQKAQRVVDAMALTLKFFWCWVGNHVEALKLPAELVPVFENHLLPMAYIEVHLPKARNAKQRQQRRDLHRQLEIELNDNEAWQLTTSERKVALQAEAKKCAVVFQRSSSCVEGRNGQLSLKHHASRKMSARKLAASTVIHNYFITRQDGTTAAERLFEQPPDDLFEWLLEYTDYPPLPAQKRSKAGELRAVA
jgi:hypothetical protein